jgi:hypothetical protein
MCNQRAPFVPSTASLLPLPARGERENGLAVQ